MLGICRQCEGKQKKFCITSFFGNNERLAYCQTQPQPPNDKGRRIERTLVTGQLPGRKMSAMRPAKTARPIALPFRSDACSWLALSCASQRRTGISRISAGFTGGAPRAVERVCFSEMNARKLRRRLIWPVLIVVLAGMFAVPLRRAWHIAEFNKSPIYAEAGEGEPLLCIGMIGDSISRGPLAEYLAEELSESVHRRIVIVNHAQASSQTVHWLPGQGRLERAIDDFKGHRVTVVIVMLGSNDSQSHNPPSAECFCANMTAIVSKLRDQGFAVILNRQPYRVPTAGMAWKTERLREYGDTLPSIPHAMMGDTELFEKTKADRALLLPDGIHPTTKGQRLIANLWAKQLEKRIR